MNHFSFRLAFAGLFLLFLVSGCQKFEDLGSLETPDRNAEFAVPLFSTQTSIQELLENFDEGTFLTVDTDGQIVLNYKGDVIATKVISGLNPECDEAAQNVVKKLKFEVGSYRNIKVQFHKTIRIHFQPANAIKQQREATKPQSAHNRRPS